eukprot:Em0001g512a
MRSLVLKYDVATLYRGYVVKQKEVMPRRLPIGQSIFYSIVRNITGVGKQQEARAGVDYIKFYDKLQGIAMAKLDDDPNWLSEIADVLLTIHQCERRSYRYMAHVMLAAQQAHHMKLAIVQMDSSTAYMVYDFKQKLLAKGFRCAEVQNQLYVEIDYTSDKERLQQLMKRTEKDDIQAEEMGVMEQEEDENDMVEEEKEDELEEDEQEQCEREQEEQVEGQGEQEEEDQQELEGEKECEQEECEQEECEQEECEQEECEQEECEQEECEQEECEQEECEQEECEQEECEQEECEQEECEQEECEQEECEQEECEQEECEQEECEQEECEQEECEQEECEQEECEQEECEQEECEQRSVSKRSVSKRSVSKEECEQEECEQEECEQEECEQEECEQEECEQEECEQEECEQEECGARGVFSCLEAALHALKQKFPHVTKLIVQNYNAKNLAGKQTKLLLPYVCSAAGLKLIAYYHNEAQSGKDVCDTHFSHQQTQVDAYLVQGDGGRNVSTLKQLAVALINTSVSNTTVLVKPNFQVPYYAAAIPTVVGISEFYAAQYVISAGKQQVQFYNCLGQKTSSACVSIPLCHACSLMTQMDAEGINFTGFTVTLNSVSNSGYMQARRDENRECLYHFNSTKLLEKHICCGAMMPRDVLSTAMQHTNGLLTRMDFLVNGAICRASNVFGNQAPCTTFEQNFFAGWAHTKKTMQPELTSEVNSVIHTCWKVGESKGQGKEMISPDGVFARLDELQLQKLIRLSELPLVGKIRGVYQRPVGNLSLRKLLVISMQDLKVMEGAVEVEGRRRQG